MFFGPLFVCSFLLSCCFQVVCFAFFSWGFCFWSRSAHKIEEKLLVANKCCKLFSIHSVNYLKFLRARGIYFSDTMIISAIVNFNYRFREQILLGILTPFFSEDQAVK